MLEVFRATSQEPTMKWNLFCVTICAYLAATLSAPPVFLESAGSRICTLNKVGKIPTGTAIKFPVYQKVCRHVIPKLGDEVNDADELNAEDETVSTGDDEVDVIRRAILGATK